MRWAFLLMCLSSLTAIAIVIRGAVVMDGLSLLAIVLMLAALLAAFLTHLAEKHEHEDRR